MSQEAKWIESGGLITFQAPTEAYNSLGSGYLIRAGETALVLDQSEYDLTFFSHGEVLFCNPIADFRELTGDVNESRDSESNFRSS